MSEQDTLRELVADLVEGGSKADRPESLWATFDEAGLFEVGIAEAAGGSGGTLSDLAVIVEATGAAGSTVPVVEFGIARWMLAHARNAGDLTGNSTAALVDFDTANVPSGEISLGAVAGARAVDTLVVCPVVGRSFTVSTADAGVQITPTSDLASAVSDTVVISAAAERRELDTELSSADIVDRFALLRAAALSGAIRGAYELTRTYVRTREQFGAPLVKLPAVASGIATIRTKVLESNAAVDAAIESENRSDGTGSTLALASRVVAARCATDTARMAHQLHGAMGTTGEYPLHTYTTALWVWRDADLSEAAWSQRLGELIVRSGEDATWNKLEASIR